jgi:hypothetical protein
LLRFAALYGMDIDRPLWKTAQEMSVGRLLSPPSNMMVTGHRQPIEEAAVLLDPEKQVEYLGDPREPQNVSVGNLDADILAHNSLHQSSRVEIIADSFPGVVSTCTLFHFSFHFTKPNQAQAFNL